MDSEERLTLLAEAAGRLRDLADFLRAERRRQLAAGGGDAARITQVLAELEPVLVAAHESEVAAAVDVALDRHGEGPWMDADLAAVAGVDLTDLRRLRDQLLAKGTIRPARKPPREN